MNKQSPAFSNYLEMLIAAIAAIAYAIPLYISKSLLFGVSDLRVFALNADRSREAGQYLFSTAGDFSRSLGISNYPLSLGLDIPWLLATSVPEGLRQTAFGLATCLALYVSVNLLGSVTSLSSPVRQVAGFVLPLIMFLPGPAEWNSIARYTSSFGWTVAVSTLGLAMFLVIMQSGGLHGPAISMKIVAVGCFLFWTNIYYLPATLPVGLLVLLACWKSRTPGARRLTYLRQCSLFLAPALVALPLFSGIYLFGVWAIPDIAVHENVDRFTTWNQLAQLVFPFGGLDKSALATVWLGGYTIRLGMLFLLIVGIWVARIQNRGRLSLLGIGSLFTFALYATTYYLVARFANRELGLEPRYLELFAYPIWILIVINLLSIVPIPKSVSISKMVRLLPVVLVAMWSTQWVIRNLDVRAQPAEYPVLTSTTSEQLQGLVIRDQMNGLFSRVILIQKQFSEERTGEGQRIRRATGFTETFYFELSYLKVPVLNAYSHMISPRTFAKTNELFGDGRPSWRQYSIYDYPNISEMPALGIRYVLSEVPIADSRLELLSAQPYKVFGLFPAADVAYLYRVALATPTASEGIRYSLTGTGLRLQGSVPQETMVTIPIEYSRCLILRSVTDAEIVTMSEVGDHLVSVTVSGDFDFEIRYENSLFQLRNCRIRDYLDFRRERNL